MQLFFELEIVYIVIGLFILGITAFVTTRDFMPKGVFKKGMIVVAVVVSLLIILHYWITVTRMSGVEELFNAGETIMCENKMRRTISKSVLLSQSMGWRLEDHLFKHDDYERDFHTARCVDWKGSDVFQEENQTK